MRSEHTSQVTMTETLWDKRDTAKYLGVSVKTLDRWLYENRGPQGIKVGVQVRFKPSSVQSFIDSCPTVGGRAGA